MRALNETCKSSLNKDRFLNPLPKVSEVGNLTSLNIEGAIIIYIDMKRGKRESPGKKTDIHYIGVFGVFGVSVKTNN